MGVPAEPEIWTRPVRILLVDQPSRPGAPGEA
jgi:hypothetical protein